MPMSRLYRPQDVVRYTDPVSGGWFDAQLLRQEPSASGEDGWTAVITDLGTYFGPDSTALGREHHLLERHLTLVTDRHARVSRATVVVIFAGLIAAALGVHAWTSFTHHATGNGVASVFSAALVLVLTVVAVRRGLVS